MYPRMLSHWTVSNSSSLITTDEKSRLEGPLIDLWRSSLGRAESTSCLPYAGIRLLWSIGYRVLSVAGSSRIQILRWSESSPIQGLRSAKAGKLAAP